MFESPQGVTNQASEYSYALILGSPFLYDNKEKKGEPK